MKNYLFAPFKDDEKIAYFNKLKDNLDTNGLTMFVGRLESYYDVIISELQAELKQTNKDYNHDVKLHEELECKQHDIIVKLEQDIKELNNGNL